MPEHPTQDAPAKATTRKAAGSRRSGLAARTEVTSAKAFPGQAPPAEQVPAPPRKAARKAAKATATKATATKATAGPAPQTLPLTEHTAPDTTSADVIPPGQPTTTTPKPTESARPAPEAAPSVPAPRPATYSWAKVAGDPGHAPELLALAAIETIGPRAAEWARGVREAYPSATSHGVARLAVAQFTRRGWVTSALAAAAGTYAPMALAGAAAWTQAELVLHLAAAYGNDPADPARAAELLVLGRVHPSLADAEAALSAVTTGTPPQRGSAGQDAVWRLGRPLATRVGGWLALRAASRFFPGTSLLVAMLTSHGAAENLSVRATAFYRIA